MSESDYHTEQNMQHMFYSQHEQEYNQWLLIAERQMCSGDAEGAAESYLQAIGLNVYSKDAHYGLYLAYKAQGDDIAADDIYGCIQDLVVGSHHSIESLIENYQRLLQNPLYHGMRDLLITQQQHDAEQDFRPVYQQNDDYEEYVGAVETWYTEWWL